MHLANITYTIDVTRVHRPDTTLAQRRRLIRDAEKKKHDSYPPLSHGKVLVPIVIDDLGGIGDEGLAALRRVAADVTRMSGTRTAEAFDLVLSSFVRAYHEAAHRHAICVGAEHSGPARHDPGAPGPDDGATPPTQRR